ncbi:MAG: HAD family hydrolase [Clostridiales bacterium]|nr:HAD family hydrolase [Clostridiales bacterium]
MLKTFALFDFDGTMIRGDSILLFMRYAWQKKLCGTFDLLRFAAAGGLFTLRLLSPKRAKELGLRFLKGRNRAAYTRAAESFCETVLKPRLYPRAMEALRKHREAGDEVLLISASPTFYLEPLKQMLNLTEVLGTDMETDTSGRFTGRIVGLNCRGDEKPQRLQTYLNEAGAQLDFETSSAYGDSRHDLPMLKLCRHAYAVSPGKKMQKKLKALDGVTVVNWKERP